MTVISLIFDQMLDVFSVSPIDAIPYVVTYFKSPDNRSYMDLFITNFKAKFMKTTFLKKLVYPTIIKWLVQ